MKRIYSISGVSPSVAKRIGKYVFGDFFIDMKVITDTNEYLFIIDKSFIDGGGDVTISYFQQFFGKNYKVAEI